MSGEVDKNDKESFTNEIGSLTIHGLPKVFSSKSNVTKALWLIICISASVFLAITAGKSITKYFKYEVVISESTQSKNHMVLPAVTFCHTNFYNPMLYKEKAPVFQHLPQNCSFTDLKYFTNEINKKLFLLACRLFIGTINARTSAVNQEMPEYFRFPKHFSIVPNIYPCFTLNRNSSLKQMANGEKHGLHMILYNEEMTDKTFTSDYGSGPLAEKREGIIVHIHDPKQHVPIADPIPIPEGFHTHIAIRKRVVKLKPSPYPSKCVQAEEQDKTSIFPGKNSLMQCYNSCFFDEYYKECSVIFLEMKSFMGPPKYTKQADYSDPAFTTCLFAFIKKFDHLKCKCSPVCEEDIYQVKVNRNPWPPKWQAPSLYHIVSAMNGAKNITPQDVRERLIKVSVYHEEMAEDVFEEKERYDVAAVFSDLGGLMGLCMGASLLSLVEILSLLISFLSQRYLHRDKVKAISIK